MLDREAIRAILPHRDPFLLVDRVLEYEPGVRAVAELDVVETAFWVPGHFPGHPVMPGVLQLEAMAQTAGILLNKVLKSEGKVAYYLGVDQAKFRRMVVPGDQVRMEIKLLKLRMGMARVAGRALVNGELACEAEMLFGGGR